jgi:hypothetical protein
MAINLNLSIMEHKKDVLLDPAYTGALERGMCMVFSANVAADGSFMVTPSTATAGEKVAGFLWSSETSQESVPVVESLSVPALAPLTVTLRELPDALANIRAFNTSTGATITVVAGAPGAGQLGIVLATGVITADAALTGVAFTITYRFTISAAELARRGGRRSVNNGAERLFNQVTIVYGNCDIQTSCFDTGDLWDVAANVEVKSGAAGRVSFDGTGTVFGRKSHKPQMLLTPGIEQAFLGVQCNLPGVP